MAPGGTEAQVSHFLGCVILHSVRDFWTNETVRRVRKTVLIQGAGSARQLGGGSLDTCGPVGPA